MAIFNVLVPKAVADRELAAEQAILVRDGFCFAAFLFAGLWLAAQRLWVALIAFLAVIGLHAALVYGGLVPLAAVPMLNLLIALWLGLEGRSLLLGRLERRHRLVARVAAPNAEEAERRFFTAWLGDGPDPQAVPPAPPSNPTRGVARAPLGGVPPVLGLFPSPAAPRQP